MPSNGGLEYGVLRDDEVEGAIALLCQAFHSSAERQRQMFDHLGAASFRVVRRRGAEIAGGLRIIPMGQWFGGARVPAAGISSVAVAPEHRGAGAASTLLRCALQEIHDEKTPLSILYPTTLTLYRRAGYELAGVRINYETPLHAMDSPDRALAVLRVGPEEHDDLRQAYARQAMATCGNLDRPAYLWSRILEPKDQTAYKYRVRREGQTEAYAVFIQEGWGKPMRVQDLCVLSPEAGRRLLAFFADHRTTVGSLVWTGGPEDALLHLLPEHKSREVRVGFWMARIVDVAGALGARAYPQGLEAELHFEVRDEALPWNNGRFVLEVANGQGQARPGGQGRIRIGIGQLAPLFTGHLSPWALRVAGGVEASEADLAMAGLVFCGPRPWMPDIF